MLILMAIFISTIYMIVLDKLLNNVQSHFLELSYIQLFMLSLIAIFIWRIYVIVLSKLLKTIPKYFTHFHIDDSLCCFSWRYSCSLHKRSFTGHGSVARTRFCVWAKTLCTGTGICGLSGASQGHPGGLPWYG